MTIRIISTTSNFLAVNFYYKNDKITSSSAMDIYFCIRVFKTRINRKDFMEAINLHCIFYILYSALSSIQRM